MKRVILIICFGILLYNLSFTQESGKFRAGLESGGLYPHEGGFGFPISIELKYNIKDNMNLGFRTEYTDYWKHNSYSANLVSFSVTYDYYYFHQGNNNFSPFIGAGLGYYVCEAKDSSEEAKEMAYSKYNNPTCFIRVGFEFCKFRTSLSYNLIRKSDELNHYNKNSDYIALNIGFYVGGGKWRK